MITFRAKLQNSVKKRVTGGGQNINSLAVWDKYLTTAKRKKRIHQKHTFKCSITSVALFREQI